METPGSLSQLGEPFSVVIALVLDGAHVRRKREVGGWRRVRVEALQRVDQYGRDLPAAVASEYFVTRTDVTQVNLSQNGRQTGRNGRRTSELRRRRVRSDAAEMSLRQSTSPGTRSLPATGCMPSHQPW
jgi:hypothetical protein